MTTSSLASLFACCMLAALPLAAEPFAEIGILKSARGAFTVVGRDRIQNQMAMRWAEGTLAKIEQATALKYPFAKRTFRIVLKEQAQEADLAVTESFSDGELVQRLVVYDLDTVNPEVLLEGYCGLLLNGTVTAIQVGQAGEKGRDRVPGRAPAWLIRGLAQNLEAAQRARNAELILDRWERGQVPGVTRLLSRKRAEIAAEARSDRGLDETTATARRQDRADCGLFVGWLLSRRDREAALKGILALAAGGKQVTAEALVECLSDCKNRDQLSEAWDRWILRQKRIVYLPGTMGPRHVRQLRGLLLLYPGDFGIPISSQPGKVLTLRDLIEDRKEDWVPAAARNLSGRLQLLSVGRPDAFKQVVAAYQQYLKALADGKRTGTLEKLLTKAEASMDALEADVRVGKAIGNQEKKD